MRKADVINDHVGFNVIRILKLFCLGRSRNQYIFLSLHITVTRSVTLLMYLLLPKQLAYYSVLMRESFMFLKTFSQPVEQPRVPAIPIIIVEPEPPTSNNVTKAEIKKPLLNLGKAPGPRREGPPWKVRHAAPAIPTANCLVQLNVSELYFYINCVPFFLSFY